MSNLFKCADCLSICDCCEFKNIKCSICKPFTSMFKAKKHNRCNSTTRYLPGDRVIVRPDLEFRKYAMDNSADGIIATNTMVEFVGKTVTISDIKVCTYKDSKPQMYTIAEHGCLWTDGMFIGRAYDHE